MEALERIREALDAAVDALAPFVPGTVKADHKSGDRGPVTDADRTVDRVLRDALLRNGDGWFSEETVDDLERLKKQRVWVVDPLDGTHEFVEGIPEWCVSVGLVENGRAIAGGICNPATGETFLGSLESGMTYNGTRAWCSRTKSLGGAIVLASRSEVKRGEWERFRNGPFRIRPVGSVAYKLALVAAGFADATWTLCAKNEWDVAAGVALVKAAGGFAQKLDNSFLTFNNNSCRLPNLLAGAPGLAAELLPYLQQHSGESSRSSSGIRREVNGTTLNNWRV